MNMKTSLFKERRLHQRMTYGDRCSLRSKKILVNVSNNIPSIVIVVSNQNN